MRWILNVPLMIFCWVFSQNNTCFFLFHSFFHAFAVWNENYTFGSSSPIFKLYRFFSKIKLCLGGIQIEWHDKFFCNLNLNRDFVLYLSLINFKVDFFQWNFKRNLFIDTMLSFYFRSKTTDFLYYICHYKVLNNSYFHLTFIQNL